MAFRTGDRDEVFGISSDALNAKAAEISRTTPASHDDAQNALASAIRTAGVSLEEAGEAMSRAASAGQSMSSAVERLRLLMQRPPRVRTLGGQLSALQPNFELEYTDEGTVLHRTTTGRVRSNRPNISNVPKSGEMKIDKKNLFIRTLQQELVDCLRPARNANDDFQTVELRDETGAVVARRTLAEAASNPYWSPQHFEFRHESSHHSKARIRFICDGSSMQTFGATRNTVERLVDGVCSRFGVTSAIDGRRHEMTAYGATSIEFDFSFYHPIEPDEEAEAPEQVEPPRTWLTDPPKRKKRHLELD